MYEFLRVAGIVPDLKVGDVFWNTEKIIEKYNEAEEKNVNICVFPELCITGYTCADLFFQKKLQNAAVSAVKMICKESETKKAVIAIGAPLIICGQLYNCGLLIGGGKVLGIVPKTFIPNYNEFYEKRWFCSGSDLKAKTVSIPELSEEEIPVGSDLVFNLGGDVRVGIEICEDLWTPLPPSTSLALGGAEVILNLSASNETISKRQYRREMIKQQSAKNLCAYVYTSAGENESTTDLIFSGHTLIADCGSIGAENKKLIDNDYLLAADIDLGKIRADRAKVKAFSDTVSLYADKISVREIVSPKCGECDGELLKIKKLPFVPETRENRVSRCMDIFEMQVAGLKKRLKVTGGKPVLGVSGGLDSTLALLVCVQTVKELGMDPKTVTAITLPCFGTSDRTYKNAKALMKALGVSAHEINIKEACTLHCRDIGHPTDKFDVTYENIQARERTQVLMDYACKIGGFVVGTGDLSELALGWCTYNADHMSMYGVNASIPKSLIRWMIDSIIEYKLFPESTEILRDINDTPISPELLPPDETGNIAQETEEIIGPYALHDFFLYHVLRYGFEPEKIFYLAKRAFEKDFSPETVLKWMKVFYKRFFTQQFKRSCLPDGVKIGSVCLSPRGDWRMPSDASAALWLSELERLS